MKGALVLSLSLAAACGTSGGGSASPPDAAPPADDAFGGVPPPVTTIAGEIHLHEFPQGGHAWALFLDQPVGLDHVNGDSITELVYAPTKIESACSLYVQPACSPACATTSYCSAPDACAILPDYVDVDAGEVDVTGSVLLSTIRLFADASANYASVPPPGPQRLFQGGEALRVADAMPGFSFDTTLPAPQAVALTSPDYAAPLHLPVAGALSLAWTTVHSDEMIIRVYAASADGSRWANIRCDTSDQGSLVVPADLMAALPPPPRSTRLEVERAEQRVVPTSRAGVGVLLHAAQTTWMNGTD